MEEIEVPSLFLCPISLEIMKDPVILSTGITYDRQTIEKWIFSKKNSTCPVTKQVLTDLEITPNHTLRRLIQSWCTLNASFGVDRIPTPKSPITKSQLVKIFNESESPHLLMKCLNQLKSIAFESETNKRYMEEAGAAAILASIISSKDGLESCNTRASDEALSILYHLQLSESRLKSLLLTNHHFIPSLITVMQGGNYESRTYSVLILKSIMQVADPMEIISLKHELFVELVQVLKDQISQQATKATLQLLINICPWGRNRIKAIEAGLVPELVGFLLDNSLEKRVIEMVLMVLDQLCKCAEGRAEFLKHGAGLAVVSKKILRVSPVASENGVRILVSIARFSGSCPSVVQEMLQLGVVAKLCLVVQVDCGSKTKEKAREILRLHSRVWKKSSCLPMNLLFSYPS